jgi:phosphoribosylformylglycinamidine (FGAM) synthase-like enzyme
MLDHEQMATIAFKAEGETVWLLGPQGTHLGQSLYLREILGREEGEAPPSTWRWNAAMASRCANGSPTAR